MRTLLDHERILLSHPDKSRVIGQTRLQSIYFVNPGVCVAIQILAANLTLFSVPDTIDNSNGLLPISVTDQYKTRNVGKPAIDWSNGVSLLLKVGISLLHYSNLEDVLEWNMLYKTCEESGRMDYIYLMAQDLQYKKQQRGNGNKGDKILQKRHRKQSRKAARRLHEAGWRVSEAQNEDYPGEAEGMAQTTQGELTIQFTQETEDGRSAGTITDAEGERRDFTGDPPTPEEAAAQF